MNASSSSCASGPNFGITHMVNAFLPGPGSTGRNAGAGSGHDAGLHEQERVV
jgi:hypothetical protein